MGKYQYFSVRRCTLDTISYVTVIAVTGRQTRQADTGAMQVPRMRTKLGQDAITCRRPADGNHLPADIRKYRTLTRSNV